MRRTQEATADRSLLIVEDNEDIALFLMHWLRKRGFRPVWTDHGREAIDLINDASFIGVKFDGLLADYRLPDATGCRIVREFLEEFPERPAAIMTAYHDLSLEIWVQAKKIPLFRKPLEFKKLNDWIASTCEPTGE